MARIFISGSSDGLGLMAAQLLVEQGHDVVIHARTDARAQQAKIALPAAQAVVIGDLSSIATIQVVAEQANKFGRFNAIIHNVGIGYREPHRVETEDGLSQIFAVNVLAPYLLTALIDRPDRLIYLSSGMHSSGDTSLDDLQWTHRRWNGSQAYADTKLHDVLLAFAVARRWPGVLSNALEPGWVPTKMGGPDAPDDLALGHVTQAWLAGSEDAAARVTGGYLYHQKQRRVSATIMRFDLQDRLLQICRDLTGVEIC
ncbi:SDR family NAD(P)-dependent oxidoreductase [Lichenicola cladoniae]|uniref:SDR family NAD(P)-dependent oxidoreductase n=1 Tax=Lichenicola cladoniae TaxID=1484109 RepID=A0A6M8HLS6_9PROT|nr:SDR family NAD(P)-dependent oxidoreductase [Lichenicola cladoniae]NPD70156.1 SDR family NAD(P)-dependent oxidoreductase [Acetobacteraceae bacterium]QKE89276.1 SDR family NAD(P)-dependent oxidoreductase [Lichenicola cladoniae]